MKRPIVRIYQSLVRILHAVKVSFSLCFRHYPYSRKRLLLTYIRILFIREKKSASGQAAIVGYQMEYQRKIQLIRLFEEIFIDEVYRFRPQKADPLVIDCGSNIGMSVLYFKMVCPAARIVAFEPHKETFEILQRNIVRNNLTTVSLHNIALGAHDGEGVMYSNPSRPLNMTVREDYGVFPKTDTGTVRCQRLSHYIHQQADLIKIDVEGSEEGILADLVKAGKLRQLNEIIVEHHTWYLKTTVEAFIGQMKSEGFVLKRIRRNSDSRESVMWFGRKD